MTTWSGREDVYKMVPVKSHCNWFMDGRAGKKPYRDGTNLRGVKFSRFVGSDINT